MLAYPNVPREITASTYCNIIGQSPRTSRSDFSIASLRPSPPTLFTCVRLYQCLHFVRSYKNAGVISGLHVLLREWYLPSCVPPCWCFFTLACTKARQFDHGACSRMIYPSCRGEMNCLIFNGNHNQILYSQVSLAANAFEHLFLFNQLVVLSFGFACLSTSVHLAVSPLSPYATAQQNNNTVLVGKSGFPRKVMEISYVRKEKHARFL